MIRPLEQAQAELADLAPILEGAIRQALSRFTIEHADQRRDYSRRSQSSIIHDLMVSEARKALEDRPGVVCMTARGTFVVVVGQTYIIKLKKMGTRLQTSNIPTQSLLDFMYQRPMQLTLAQVPTATNLIFGYQPRGSELLTSGVWAICPMGGRVWWSWVLDAALAPVESFMPAEQPADRGSLYEVRADDVAEPEKKGQ